MENRKTFMDRLQGKMSEDNIQRVMFAYHIAKECHRAQKRDHGGRYFEHPRKGCLVLMDELDIYDPVLLIAFLFHDLGEDTPIFGNITQSYDVWLREATFRISLICPEAVPLVIGLTKPAIDGISFNSKQEVYDYYLSQLELGRTVTIFLKMVDRLINLREVDSCTEEKISKQIKETKEVYFPIFRKAISDAQYGQQAQLLLEKIAAVLRTLERRESRNSSK